MELAASQAFANFRAWVPRNALTVGSLHPQAWTYYDWGPRSYSEPLLCFHSLVGSSESFFHQIISLAPRGYRVLSVQIPVYWTVDDFCDSFNAFLNMLNLAKVHVYAAGLGGFLALHFNSRKPERIASIALTHSFLSSEPFKHSIPYSPSVLRWLPDFLVRSTMKSILPKGRTSRDQALAAEFAIGHTLNASRDVLASRLALFVSTSSVSTHLPKSNTTLIDTLDREQNSLQMSSSVAKELSSARRAYLKHGGDFPYLSVPDEVNVHLVVHLRRHAPSPESPVPLPPPARPHPLPAAVLQRKREEALRAQQESTNSNSTPPQKSKSERTRESLLAEARALVEAEERATIEKYCFEISKLRDVFPDREDRFLAAIIADCSGDIDTAIANASNDVYPQHFYEEFHGRAINEAFINISKAAMAENDKTATAQNRKDTDRDSAIGDTEDSLSDSDARHIATKDERSHEHDPLGGSNFVINGGSQSVDGVESRDSKSTREALKAILRNNKEAPQNEDSREVEDKNSVDYDSEIGSNSPVSDRNGLSDQKVRPGRRRRMESNAMDGVSTYVTSERVGMRSAGPMVGRGPTPFKASTGSEETWAQSRSPSSEGKHEPMDVVRIDDDGDVIASGASLLEASENPLDLPGAEASDRSAEIGRSGWSESLLPSPGASITGVGVDDGREGTNLWETFNQRGDDERESVNERTEENAGDRSLQSDSGDGGSEEEERLRMWSMSALTAASKSIPR